MMNMKFAEDHNEKGAGIWRQLDGGQVGPVDGIHWVIVGGESGPGARPIEQEWVENILSQCRNAEVAFFFKQWGGAAQEPDGARTSWTDI